jgi:hypothetical protein
MKRPLFVAMRSLHRAIGTILPAIRGIPVAFGAAALAVAVAVCEIGHQLPVIGSLHAEISSLQSRGDPPRITTGRFRYKTGACQLKWSRIQHETTRIQFAVNQFQLAAH